MKVIRCHKSNRIEFAGSPLQHIVIIEKTIALKTFCRRIDLHLTRVADCDHINSVAHFGRPLDAASVSPEPYQADSQTPFFS